MDYRTLKRLFTIITLQIGRICILFALVLEDVLFITYETSNLLLICEAF